MEKSKNILCTVTTEMWNKFPKINFEVDNVMLKLKWKVTGER